jgi:hypothetical protein
VGDVYLSQMRYFSSTFKCDVKVLSYQSRYDATTPQHSNDIDRLNRIHNKSYHDDEKKIDPDPGDALKNVR